MDTQLEIMTMDDVTKKGVDQDTLDPRMHLDVQLSRLIHSFVAKWTIRALTKKYYNTLSFSTRED